MERNLTDKQLNRLANGREYRAMSMECREGEEDRMVVEGYACTFGQPYNLYDSVDYKVTEQIDARAFDGCDMSDVIMQYDHEGAFSPATETTRCLWWWIAWVSRSRRS